MLTLQLIYKADLERWADGNKDYGYLQYLYTNKHIDYLNETILIPNESRKITSNFFFLNDKNRWQGIFFISRCLLYGVF